MRPIYKFLAQAGFTAALCVLLTVPSMAQRGGHSGGGGGGGGGSHSSGGGGGFSGGSHASGGGFSAPRSGFSAPRSSGISAPRGGSVSAPRTGTNYASRSSAGVRSGAVGIAPRGYVRSVTATPGVHALATRGYVPGAYGHSYTGGGVYARPYGWGLHGGYFYAHGYYGALYYPWLGFSCGYLPWGYYPFWWGGAYFYYSDGLFYNYENEQYTVVEPPVGASVNKLPSKAQSIVIDGQQYYEMNGVYYQPITKDDGTTAYEVVGKDGVLNTNGSGAAAVTPHVGDVTETLPPGCRKVKLNGNTLYVSDDGIYYQETQDQNGKKAYKIVALESDNQDGQ
jgi:hypothetical protein